jgi:hypothetical protein
MPNSYTSLRYHVTFSTKDRFPWTSQDWNTDLHRYIGGVARMRRKSPGPKKARATKATPSGSESSSSESIGFSGG